MPDPQTPLPGQPSPGEKMRDAVANVMQKVSEDKKAIKAGVQAEHQQKLRRGRRAWLLLFLAALGLGISLAYGLPRWRQPFKPPTGAAAERDARRAIMFAQSLVERFRQGNGRVPASLAEAGVALPGIAYRVTPDGYEISATVAARTIVFRSGDDPVRFRGGASQ